MVRWTREDIEQDYDFYAVPKQHREDSSISENYCPKCNTPGRWRSGPEFDNQKICSKCWSVWEPGKILNYRREVSEILKSVNGEGI